MNFWIDFKYAVRLLMKKPAFTALTVAVMACGLGLCVYNASFIYATMFKPLPFENGDRMVVIDKQIDNVLHNGGQVKFAYYQDIKAQNSTFDMVGAMQQYILTISGGENATSYRGVYSEPALFEYTKTNPIKGRVFNANDDTPGANPVAVIGYDLWQNYFAGTQDIIGKQFLIEGVNTEVIGVMPQNYLFPRASQLWMPIKFEPQTYKRSTGPTIQVYGLLKPGVTTAQANADMKQIIARANAQDPDLNTGEVTVANTFMVSMMGNDTLPIMIIMLTAVAFVLLLACINVGNLLYARSAERAKETAVRVALGAPQSRLIMQMLWESLIICSLGGVFAILLSAYGLEVTNKVMPGFISGRAPFWWHIEIDSSLIWFTVALTLITAFITGILPARKIINGDFNAVLRDGTRGALSRKAKQIGKALVIFEVTLSVALLTASIVMVVAVNKAMNVDYGAKTTNMMTARIGLPEIGYDTPEKRLTYFQTLKTELSNIPGATGVALATALPAVNGSYRAVLPEGLEMAKNAVPPRASTVDIMPGSMETMEYRLLQGRFFSESDNINSENVVIITNSFADKIWPNEPDVIGKRVQWAGVENPQWYRIIGVVDHVIHGQPFADFKTRPAIYRSNLQTRQGYLIAAVKTDGDASKLREAMVKAIDKTDGNVPAFRVKTIEQVVQRNTAGISFVITLFVMFGIAATILAGSGIYALMANSIDQRTHEFGVRRALGASDEQVVKMLLKQGFIQFLIGTIIGLPLAVALGSIIIKVIAVESMDIYAAFAYIPLFIGTVVMLATYIPALKVTRLEPNVALRHE